MLFYKGGMFYHSGTFPDYSDTTIFHRGNYGFYVIVDQAFFNRSLHAGRGLLFFTQAGFSPGSFNQIGYYIGAGLRYHGLISGRFYDEIGLAFATVGLGKPYKKLYQSPYSNETTIEATYKFKFGKNYSIQPNIQYIINPGTGEYNNCFVSLIRFTLEY
ncbi:MAG: carbohydrate porin [Bacteroidales bacterium]|nr:carbohydrate porin [Bacteroidales bacterium]